MYFFDKNVFMTLGHYYPSRFPTIWAKIDGLATEGTLRSVREVRNEIEANCQFESVAEWVKAHRFVFLTPTDEEMRIVADIFKAEQYRGLVKRANILKGLPVADPFIVAAAMFYGGSVVTQESVKAGGARIPTLCKDMKVDCIDLEEFLGQQNLRY